MGEDNTIVSCVVGLVSNSPDMVTCVALILLRPPFGMLWMEQLLLSLMYLIIILIGPVGDLIFQKKKKTQQYWNQRFLSMCYIKEYLH